MFITQINTEYNKTLNQKHSLLYDRTLHDCTVFAQQIKSTIVHGVYKSPQVARSLLDIADITSYKKAAYYLIVSTELPLLLQFVRILKFKQARARRRLTTRERGAAQHLT